MRRSSSPNALIISSAGDAHVPIVADKLMALGVQVTRLDTNELGTRAGITLRFGDTRSEEPRGLIKIRGQEEVAVDADAITSVWYRRPVAPDLSSYDLSLEGRAFARDEWRAGMDGLFTLLSNALWVSHPERIRVGENKALQLSLARGLGFVTPETLITSDASAALEFWDRFSGAIIAKPLGLGWVYVDSNSEQNRVRSVFTNEIDEAALRDLDNLKIAPTVFQEAIPKTYELRVTVVGSEVLSIRIDSQKSQISCVDWRRYDLARTPYMPYRLPEELEDRCRQLVSELKLQYGAIDLIRKPDGEYVFLEINCNGQFAWAEQLAGVPISTKLARLLAGLDPPL